MVIPHDLRQAKIGNLDLANAARTNSRDEIALINLVFITRLLRLGVFGRNDWDRAEEDVFRLDITGTLYVSRMDE